MSPLAPRRRILLLAGTLLSAPAWVHAQAGLTAEAQTQVAALMADKGRLTPSQRKLASLLRFAQRASEGLQIAPGIPDLPARAASRLQRDRGGRILTDIRADVTPALLDELGALGGEIVNAFPGARSVRAWLPAGQLESAAALPDVAFIRQADLGFAHGNPAAGREARPPSPVGPNLTAGDHAHLADVIRARLVTGSGIKVGVLSDGVDSLSARQAAGDLGGVTVLSGQAGSGDEGTAMLEIVHDLAPGAALYFATANNGEAAFASNIQALRAAGCDVIIDDFTYIAEGVFQDGPVARAVSAATASGAMFFSSAGNFGNKGQGTSETWEGDFSPGTVDDPYVFHRFGSSSSDPVTAHAEVVFLQWSDPLDGSANDYDLFLADAGGNLVDFSQDVQSGTQDPFEILGEAFTGEQVFVARFSGQTRALHVGALLGRLAIGTTGATWGHNAAGTAVTMAAVDAATAQGGSFTGFANPVESYSSDGPRRIFYGPTGNPITPGNVLFGSGGGTLLAKVDLTAADCVATGTPGFEEFCGTSAAAPHAGAIAALALSLPVRPTPAQVLTAMRTSALDTEAAGFDPTAGSGIVMALGTVNVLGADLSVTVTDGRTFVVPGTPVTYTIVVANAGRGPVYGAQVTSSVVGSLTGITWTCTPAGGAACGSASGVGNIAQTVNLPVGSSVTYSLTGTVDAAFSGTVTVQASVRSPTAFPSGALDPNPANNDAADSDPTQRQCDLSLVKTDGRTSIIAGTPTTYTITVTSAGPSVCTGIVSDTLPPALTGVTWTCSSFGGGTCLAASGTGSPEKNDTLPPGGGVVYALSGTVAPGASGTLSNTATVNATASTDPNTANNSSTDNDTILLGAEVSVTKTDGTETAAAGQSVAYTIVVTNAGPNAVNGATVADSVPAELQGAAWTCVPSSGAACTASGSGSISDSVNLPVNGTVTYTLTGTVAPAAHALQNTATVSLPSGYGDPDPSNNSATDYDLLVCGNDRAAVPDGRAATGSLAASGSEWFFFRAHPESSYSVEVTGDGAVAPTLVVSAGNDGCAASTVAVRDTSSLSPVTAAGGRGSFTAAASELYYRVRVTNPGPDPVAFTLGVAETSLFSAAFSTNGTYNTYYSLRNTTVATISGTLAIFASTGEKLAEQAVTIGAGQTAGVNTVSLPVPRGKTGTARFTHDGPPDAVLVEAAVANFTTSPAYVQRVKFKALRDRR